MSTPFCYNRLMKNNFEAEITKTSQVLSDPIRIKILLFLKNGRDDSCISNCKAYPKAICPTDLQIKLDGLSSSKLSYHLKMLKEEQFIQEHREGKRIFYFLRNERFQEFIHSLDSLFVNVDQGK